jgi:hypothetical protein
MAQKFNDEWVVPILGEGALDAELQTKVSTLSSSFQSLFVGLTARLQTGTINAQQFASQFGFLSEKIEAMSEPEALLILDQIVKGLDPELESFIGKLSSIEDKIILLNAAAVGVTIEQPEMDAIKASDEDPLDETKLKAKERALKNINDRIKVQADLLEGIAELPPLSISEENDAASESIENQVIKLKDQQAAYDNLILSGFSAAEAISLLGDESIVAAAKNGVLTEALRGQIAEFLQLQSAAQARTGGGGSNPIQDAIKGLKEQRTQILNTSAAYGELRKSGMSASDSFKFAQNSELISAMNAGLKVGSARWNEIIGLIKEAEAATLAWQNSTVEGKTEQFEDVYDRVMNLFSAEEAVINAAFESATKTDNKLIESLQEQIDAFNRQINDYSRDLEGIAESEDAINKSYDEKVKALEKVKKVNGDILRQQKSQISLADALSQGDISAAANIIEEKRAADAASALEAQGNQAAFARDAQLAGVTSKSGLTRVQIEEKVKQLKKQIADIEFGALRDAQDRVEAAEKELRAKEESLTVAGKTKTEIEEAGRAIDLARARAEIYDDELQNALASVEGIVSGWKSLDRTVTTTHVVNTVTTTNGSVTSNTNSNPETTLTRAQMISKAESELTDLRKDFTRAETAGWSRAGGLLTQIRQKESDLARLKYQGGAFAAGGYISGPGTATSDSIPAMLSDGEYVIKAASVNKFGKGFLDAINAGKLPGFKMGGMIIPDRGKSSKTTPPKTPINIRAIERAASTRPIGKSANALAEFIKNPMTGYSSNLNKASLETFVNKNIIPSGQEMYRTLTPGELNRIQQSLSSGTDYKPGQVRSFAGSSDLQTLGDSMSSKGSTRFGGANDLSRTIAQITAMEDLKGIQNVNRFGNLSQLNQEGILGPDTRYKLISQTPATATSPGMMRFGAFARAMGPVGYLGDIIEMMRVFGGTSDLLQKPQFQFAKGGMVKPSYFARGGMVKPSYFAAGGMVKKYAAGGIVKPSYYSQGGFAKGTDTVPAMLTPGEFVVNRESSKTFAPLLSSINNEGRDFALPVYPQIQRDYPEAALSGGIYQKNEAVDLNAQVDNSVYNYTLSVNVNGTNANASDIANVVMNKIKTMESQQVRKQVLR